jgi:hypothetical protein
MTPKEKAQELVNKFAKLPEEGTLMWYLSFEIAKKCALIAVDEILSVITNSNDYYIMSNYYQQVKKEIENL